MKTKNRFLLLFMLFASMVFGQTDILVECKVNEWVDKKGSCAICPDTNELFTGLEITRNGGLRQKIYAPFTSRVSAGKFFVLKDAFGHSARLDVAKIQGDSTLALFSAFLAACQNVSGDALPGGGTNGQLLQTDGAGGYSWVDQLDETAVDAFVANNGYLTSEVDGSVTNEIELPAGGSDGQVLKTDGVGNYEWVDQTGGGVDIPSLESAETMTEEESVLVNRDGEDYKIQLDDFLNRDYCYMRMLTTHNTDLTAGLPVKMDGVKGTLNAGNYKVNLRAGKTYKGFGVTRSNFPDATSWAAYHFHDVTRNEEISYLYTGDGWGTRSLNVPMQYAGNNSEIESIGFVITPDTNTEVEMRINSVNGTISSIVREYTFWWVEEIASKRHAYPTAIRKLGEIQIDGGNTHTEHIQGVQMLNDSIAVASFADKVQKFNVNTGALVGSAWNSPGGSHIGAPAVHNGSIYVPYTLLSAFNNTPTSTTIYEIDPTTMATTNSNTISTPFAGGGMGSNDTTLYIVYGGTSLDDCRFQEVNPSTLELEGAVIIVDNNTTEFGHGTQGLYYDSVNNWWYFLTHLKGDPGDPSQYNGGGLVIMDASFNVLNIIRNDYEDWAGGYGNGFVIKDGYCYWTWTDGTSSPYSFKWYRGKLLY